MKPLLLGLLCVVLSIRDSSSGFISTPGIQRIYLSDSCTFQWVTTGPVTNVKVYNQTLGTATNLSKNASYIFYNITGVIRLTITNVRFWDAGNYSATVTTGATNEINSEALLYVCGYSSDFINQTAGPNPPTEGDPVELTCTYQLSSSPAAYRLQLYYYYWDIGEFGVLQNISNGPAVFLSGDVFTGYSIKNNGRTLAIASAQYQDTKGFACYLQEEGCPRTYNSDTFYLPLRYRPQISLRIPACEKYNPNLFENVEIFFDFQANPPITSKTNWSFVSAEGLSQGLPPNTEYPRFSNNSYEYLSFNFTSVSYYGNYSRTATNSIGSTTATFQVLPQGRPDQLLSLKLLYASHDEIGLQCSCGWYNGLEQTIFIQIYNIGNNTAVSTSNSTLFNNAYNFSSTATFQDNIEADKEYEARAWASNALGSSDVIKLRVRTTKKLKFNVSPETIRFNGFQAIINFTASDGNVSGLVITCCIEYSGICKDFYFYVYNTNGIPTTQVICDNIPKGNDYVFDFVVYSGNRDRDMNFYFAAMIKGLRVSRTGTTQSNEVKDSFDVNALRIAAIVLAILLGISCLVWVGIAIAFCAWKCRDSERKKISPAESTHHE